MLIEVTDFNGAAEQALSEHASEWQDLEEILTAMPLHVKASDQAGKQGRPIFDPVGTNQTVKAGLVARGWRPNVPIPAEYSFLGGPWRSVPREGQRPPVAAVPP